ncbi:MAG: AAA family ATPase [Magnetococcales bacterium]|nr:AAA family ATPase [Magnetococcales bacterium]
MSRVKPIGSIATKQKSASKNSGGRDAGAAEEKLIQKAKMYLKGIGSEPVSALHLSAQACKPIDWISYGNIIRRKVTMLHGTSGVGKTGYGLQMAVILASGMEWGSARALKPVKVLYINMEEAQEEIMRRVRGICHYFSIDEEKALGNILISGRRQEEMSLATFMPPGLGDDTRSDSEARRENAGSDPVFAKYSDESGKVEMTPYGWSITAFAKSNNVDVIFIDPLQDAMIAAENLNEQARGVMNVFRQVAELAGSAVHLVHHNVKAEAPGEQHSARGASAISGVSRGMESLCVAKPDDLKKMGIDNSDGDRYLRLDTSKSNYSPTRVDFILLRQESIEVPGSDPVGILVEHDAEAGEMDDTEGDVDPFLEELVDRIEMIIGDSDTTTLANVARGLIGQHDSIIPEEWGEMNSSRIPRRVESAILGAIEAISSQNSIWYGIEKKKVKGQTTRCVVPIGAA